MLRLIFLLLVALLAACMTTRAPSGSAFSSDRISVETRGSGPDVVLITGLASHPEVWDGTIAAVPGYRYHLVHVAGFAGKAAAGNASGPVVPPVAEEIARYIRESGLDRPAIVGFSLGGTWAMMIAARHPGLASRVMVVDTPPFLGPLVGAADSDSETIRPVAEQLGARIAGAVGERRRREIEEAMAGQVSNESLRPLVVDHLIASDPVVSGQAMYDLFVTDLRPEIGNIRVPMTVLFVTPPGGPMNPEQIESYYRSAFAGSPGSVLKRISNSYHFIMFDQPEQFRRELRLFLGGS